MTDIHTGLQTPTRITGKSAPGRDGMAPPIPTVAGIVGMRSGDMAARDRYREHFPISESPYTGWACRINSRNREVGGTCCLKRNDTGGGWQAGGGKGR